MGARSAVPYTSLEEIRMKRSTGVSRTASRRICVPSTFVVTNSEAPSAIDFSTCDSAAAFTITSTSDTTSWTSSASRTSPWTNESRSCDITSARFSRLPAYVSASSETTSCGVARSRWRMKFDEMNPAPPVTRTRFGTRGSVTVGRRRRAGRPPTDQALRTCRVDVLVEPALREARVAYERRGVRRRVDVVRHIGARLVHVEAVRVVVRAGLARIRAGHEIARVRPRGLDRAADGRDVQVVAPEAVTPRR